MWSTGSPWQIWDITLVKIPLPASPSYTAHSDLKGLKSAHNTFTWSDFMRFSKKVSADSHSFRFQSLHSLHIQIRQFHEYFNLILGGFLLFGPTLWRRLLCTPVVTDALHKGAFWQGLNTIKILSHFFLLIRWDGLPERKIKNVKQVEGKKWLTLHSFMG